MSFNEEFGKSTLGEQEEESPDTAASRKIAALTAELERARGELDELSIEHDKVMEAARLVKGSRDVHSVYEVLDLIPDLRSRLAAAEAERDLNMRNASMGWAGLQNLYTIITGQTCEKEIALGMATSAVDRLQKDRDALREQAARLLNIPDFMLGDLALDVSAQAIVRPRKATAIEIGRAVKRLMREAIDAALATTTSEELHGTD